MVLSLIYSASIADLEAQLQNVLGFASESKQSLVWNDAAGRLDAGYEGVCLGI
jgi:hypothetical protein